ncbi:MAG: hypothetical protein QM733_02780 [Ilumatobacteraceae bacterium]
MLANIWHWWIGVVLFVVAVVAAIGLIGGYLRNVVAPQHPGKHNPEE